MNEYDIQKSHLLVSESMVLIRVRMATESIKGFSMVASVYVDLLKLLLRVVTCAYATAPQKSKNAKCVVR